MNKHMCFFLFLEPVTEDVTAMEIEAKGFCEPLSCMLQPYAIHIPGLLTMETAVKRQFRVSLLQVKHIKGKDICRILIKLLQGVFSQWRKRSWLTRFYWNNLQEI